MTVSLTRGGGIILFVPLFMFSADLGLGDALFHTALIIFLLSVVVVSGSFSVSRYTVRDPFYLSIPVVAGFLISKLVLTVLLPGIINFQFYNIPPDIIYYVVVILILLYSGFVFSAKDPARNFIRNNTNVTLLFIEGFIPAGGLVFATRSAKVSEMEPSIAGKYIFTLLLIKSVLTVAADYSLLSKVNSPLIILVFLSALSGFKIAQFCYSRFYLPSVRMILGVILLFTGGLLLIHLFIRI
jgi:hypothetical protein